MSRVKIERNIPYCDTRSCALCVRCIAKSVLVRAARKIQIGATIHIKLVKQLCVYGRISNYITFLWLTADVLETVTVDFSLENSKKKKVKRENRSYCDQWVIRYSYSAISGRRWSSKCTWLMPMFALARVFASKRGDFKCQLYLRIYRYILDVWTLYARLSPSQFIWEACIKYT